MDFSCLNVPLDAAGTQDATLRADILWSNEQVHADSDDPVDFREVALQMQVLARQFDHDHVDILADHLASALYAVLGHPFQVTVTVHGMPESGLYGDITATAVVRQPVHGDIDTSADSRMARMIDGVPFPVPAPAKADQDASHAASDTVGMNVQLNHAIIAMESSAVNAQDLLRASVVMFDGIPGNQVSGISPLYFASNANGDMSNTAVLGLDTTMNLKELVRMLESVGMTHEGIVKLSVLAFNGESVPDAMQPGPWATGNHTRAAFLSPWSDMEPQATLDGDPLAFLLAEAPDAMFSGLESNHWILGGEG